MLLIVGVKGGVGTTLVALELARCGQAVALDLADGQFAARLERPTWPLGSLVFVHPGRRRSLIEAILTRSIALVWSTDCNAAPDLAWSIVTDIDHRQPVVIDGGIEPSAGVEQCVDRVILVKADDALARWHETRLKVRFPRAQVVAGQRQAARELAVQIFNGTKR